MRKIEKMMRKSKGKREESEGERKEREMKRERGREGKGEDPVDDQKLSLRIHIG